VTWESVLLEDVATIGDGLHGTPIYDENGKYYFINGNNLRNGRIVTDENTKRVNEHTFESLRIEFSQRTVFMSINGTIGNAAFFRGERIAIGKSVAYFNVNSAISPNYLFYYLQTYQLLKYFEEALTGSTIRNLGLNVIRKATIQLPPLPEQHRIAAVLSDADAYIAALEKLLAKKRDVKQGVMQELLTGKRRLAGFEGEWETAKFGDICDIVRGGSPRPIDSYLTTSSNGINWIKIGDVEKDAKYIRKTAEKIIPEGAIMSRPVKKDDFILSNSMSFGRPYILQIDGCIHDGWLAIQNYEDKFESEFLYYLLSSEWMLNQYRERAAGSSVQNLNKDVVSGVDVIMPTLTEQNAIADILSDMDTEIDGLTTKLVKARLIKQGMMSELLTGRIKLNKEYTDNGEN
jgi:type I restriction enzyme S subunit